MVAYICVRDKCGDDTEDHKQSKEVELTKELSPFEVPAFLVSPES
jgi:hypothetical protein